MNVPSMVKRHETYILSRCPSNNHQILYSEERFKDLIELTEPLEVNGDLNVNDTLRVFKGG